MSTEVWEVDERVWGYWRLRKGEIIVKLKQHEALECEADLKNTMPAHSGTFIPSNSKRIMNKLLRLSDGFETINAYYSNTDNLYNEKSIRVFYIRLNWLQKSYVEVKTIIKRVVSSKDCSAHLKLNIVYV